MSAGTHIMRVFIDVTGFNINYVNVITNTVAPIALVNFSAEKINEALAPAQLHEFGMYLNNQWYKLTAKENTYTQDPIGILDISILSNNILDPILNIKDQRTDKRIDFVGGIRGLNELEKRVNSGEMGVAFSLHPVTIQQLFDIADSGNVMPPKSTWFEPKLRDGLLTHLIDGAEA